MISCSASATKGERVAGDVVLTLVPVSTLICVTWEPPLPTIWPMKPRSTISLTSTCKEEHTGVAYLVRNREGQATRREQSKPLHECLLA